MKRTLLQMSALAGALLYLTGCESGVVEAPREHKSSQDRRTHKSGKLFGDDFFKFGGDKDSNKTKNETSGIGVNTFLWRATLDVLAFMPLKSADPFGGVIITDWYTTVEAPSERFKIDARIFDRQLRVDGLKISVFKQIRSASGIWEDAPVDPQVMTQIEDAILARARQMKQENA